MEITLKGIKLYEKMSHETTAFSATLYIDGKKACDVGNIGQGGSHEYGDWSVARRLDEYAKTLPVRRVTFGETSYDIPQSADSLVTDALELLLKAKEEAKFRRMAEKDYTTRLCYENDGAMMTTKSIPATFLSVALDTATKQGKTPLNLLPFDEFYAAWKRLVIRTA